jgi:arylsulfatase A-like enzyme
MRRGIVLAVAFLLSSETLSAAEKPNVVLILCDDLGWADLGCYASKYHKTPHLDRLADDGVRFTDAYAACPVCSPTRASLLTGRYPQRYNLTDWLPGRPDRPDQKLLRPKINQQLPLEEITLAEALKPAGYVSGQIGKWHLGGKSFEPEKQGFDIHIAGDQTGTARSYFAPFRSKDGTFMPGLETAPDGEYLTDRLTTEAEKFLDANRDRPFFLYLAHYAPHIPLRAKPELVAKYKPGKHGEQGNPDYAAMLESIDEGVGRLLKKLDDLKLAERTLLVFTSDNGGLATLEGSDRAATYNGPLREGKGYLYEGGIRAPLIVRWPGVTKAGSTCSVPVSSIDLFPTALDACGVKSETKVDGLSLVPLLKGGELKREALYWHYPHYANQGSRPGGAVRAGDYKLIEFYENGRRELYDLKKDVSESQNLVADKPEVAKELAANLDAWRQDVGAKMMTPNPDFIPNPQAKDGTITLPARTADVHGIQLRYEPLPHKDTLGFWTRADDWVSWEFTVTKPGTFTVEILQGCGKGQGGSEVELAVGTQTLKFTVEDTGHFQNFKARALGTLTIDKAGRSTLTLKAGKKAAAAVMDVRSVKMQPVTNPK